MEKTEDVVVIVVARKMVLTCDNTIATHPSDLKFKASSCETTWESKRKGTTTGQ